LWVSAVLTNEDKLFIVHCEWKKFG